MYKTYGYQDNMTDLFLGRLRPRL